MPATGKPRLTTEEIQAILDEKTKGVYTYIPDPKFPYKGERSKILIKDNETGEYLVRTFYYIRYQMKGIRDWRDC